MKHSLTSVASRLVVGVACFAGLSAPAQAQTRTVVYDLEDVWLLPDITHPRASARQMTGAFEWTYTVGDFENGSGRFLEYAIPWWSGSNLPPLAVNIEPGSIEFTMVGNYHGLGLDLTLRFAPPLSPDQPSPIDTVRSQFDVEVGISHRGHVIRGGAVPRCTLPQNYGNGSAGSGGLVPTITSSGGDPRIGNRTFQIDCDQLLGEARCVLLLGSDKIQFPLLGVTVLVNPWFTAAVTADGTAGVPGDGALHIPMRIPNDALLVGAELDFQVLAIDPGSPQGMASATDGLTMVICE